MPSQVSLREVSTVLVDARLQLGKKVGSRNSKEKIQAAAGPIDTPLIGYKASQTMVSSLQSTYVKPNNSAMPLKCSSQPLTNGNTVNMNVGKHGNQLEFLNGMVGTTPLVAHVNAGHPKTEGAHSSDQSSITNQSNSSRLMCPELAISYSSSLIGKRTNYLASKQKVLEKQVASLQQKVRLRQLHLVHSFACKQICEQEESQTHKHDSLSVEGSASTLTGSDCSMLTDTPSRVEVMPLPIQVDGACDDAFLPQTEVSRGMDGGEVRMRGEDSFSSVESYVSSVPSEAEGSEVKTISTQLRSLEELMDSDLTEYSSDEEGDEPVEPPDRLDLRKLWDQSRLAVGSRWAWLQRRIAELNKQIYRLDHHIKETSSREKFCFAVAPSPPVIPQYFSIPNGSVLEQLRGSNGSGLVAFGGKPGGNNGFSHHPSGHTLPNLLLPEALIGAKLQVKDLLSPSPLGRNLLYLDEASSTTARTRAMVQRAKRRIIRRKVPVRTQRYLHGDMSFHPQLSMAHELSSRLSLDSAVKQMLSEHSYAQLPLSKRHKVVSSLSTPYSHRFEFSRSASPSPIHTPQSLELNKGSSSRKKPVFIHHQTSLDSIGSSPWSPGVFRPSTPGLTPLQPARKKRMTSSTPLFDIDNIVIPYSIASSTRLEKLEYKEIMTPSWRIVEGQDFHVDEGLEHEEDLSDQAITARHNRCELTEKKRFFNFITGSQRKRSRPQSATMSESPSLSSPPPRRLTIASPSPTTTETELATHIHPVVLPWQPRVFPLNESNQEALLHPPPPPPISTHLSSPRQFRTGTPSQTPSCTSSAFATPLTSPISTLSEETSAISPAEWVVNPQLPASPAPFNHRDISSDSSLSNYPLILKLTKKV